MAKTRLADVAMFGKESTWGTGAAATIALFLDEPLDIKPIANTKEDNPVIGRLESNIGEHIVSKSSEISGKGIARRDSLGLLLMQLFGTVTKTAGSPEATVNTFDFVVKNDNVHPSYQVETGAGILFDSGVKQVLGTRLDSLSLDIVKEDYMKFDAKWKGKYPSTGTNASFAATSETVFMAKHATIKLAANIAGLGAASAINFVQAKIKFAKKAELAFGLALDPLDIFPTQFEITGEFTIDASDSTYFDLSSADTYKALRFQMIDTGTTIGTTTNPKFTLDISQVKLKDWGLSGGKNNRAEQTFAFNAHYSLTDAKMATAQLINTFTAY
ncbi:MAG: phage tail tube protein [Candidatus Peregrinibacteria bacterium]